MRVPKHFPPDSWSPSGELRSYIDMDAAFGRRNFSMTRPIDLLDIRHVRRGYFAATSFADANLGRVMDALTAAGPTIAHNTITMLWSDHGWHLGDTNSFCKVTNFETGARNTLL